MINLLKLSNREIKFIKQNPKIAKLAASFFFFLSFLFLLGLCIAFPYFNEVKLKDLANKNHIYKELNKINPSYIDPELKILINNEVASNVNRFLDFEFLFYLICIGVAIISTAVCSLHFKIINLVLNKE